MLVAMKVVDVKELDDYIDENEVPFAVCTPPYGVTSNRQQRFLDKYYDKITDKKGQASYYCNIINAWKCRESGYKGIKFSDGKVEEIKNYSLEKNDTLRKGYVVTPNFKSGKKINALSLVKQIRLEVEKVKIKVNAQTR